MTRLLILAPILGFIALPVYSYMTFSSPPALPDLDVDAWWGPSELKGVQDNRIIPFEVSFRRDMINNLREQLKRCQDFTPPLEDTNFEYGFNSDQLYGWCRYWAEEYPFNQREKSFNRHPQFKIFIQGLWIHFIWVKPKVPPGVETVPLLLLHGWPSSVRMFDEAIPMLTAVSEDRDFAFEAIIPSLPGFGFSDGAAQPGLGAAEISVILNILMTRLGFDKYYVQGGDWGSIIGSSLVTRFPKRVLGYHSNMPWVASLPGVLNELIATVFPSLVAERVSDLGDINSDLADSDSELADISVNMTDRLYQLQEKYAATLEETGYLHIQATKPDTIGVALTDSPIGLLAYILENISTWTRLENRYKPDGGLNFRWAKEKLIDNLMMYWVPRCITTSMRIYAESFNTKQLDLKLDEIPTPVPTWLTQAKHEIIYQPKFIYEFKYPNLVNWTVIDNVGHFIPSELPEIFSEDVIRAVATFRKLAQDKVKSDL